MHPTHTPVRRGALYPDPGAFRVSASRAAATRGLHLTRRPRLRAASNPPAGPAHARLRRRSPGDPIPAVVAVIPAHNEEGSIAATLDSLLGQSTPAAHIFVVADNCSDRTEDIVATYQGRGVTLLRTEGNSDRKVGALLAAWDQIGDLGYDLWLGVDADTILDRDCLGHLTAELWPDRKLGGVMARYSFDQRAAHTATASYLTRMQRLEFAGWTQDLLLRDRETYVLGGQTSLFRIEALKAVADMPGRAGPWSTATLVEDMEATWRIKDAGYRTKVSVDARSWPGAMPSWRALWGQRRKWDQGMAALLKDAGHTARTVVPWRLQYKIMLDFAVRAGFFVMLAASVTFAMFTWFWIWALPPILAILLNAQTAHRMPKSTAADVTVAATLVGMEIYLIFRLACWAKSWADVLAGRRSDGWARQYAAESGTGAGHGWRQAAIVAAVVAAASWATWHWQWVAALRAWQPIGAPWLSGAVGAGWVVVTVLTALSAAEMISRLLRADTKMRP